MMKVDSHARKTASQPSLFGDEPSPARYVPKPEHVRSGLRSLLDRLSQAQTWLPWSDWDIQRYRERDVNYYCGLLPDKAEASDWRRRLEAEVARLDAATAEIKASTSAAA